MNEPEPNRVGSLLGDIIGGLARSGATDQELASLAQKWGGMSLSDIARVEVACAERKRAAREDDADVRDSDSLDSKRLDLAAAAGSEIRRTQCTRCRHYEEGRYPEGCTYFAANEDGAVRCDAQDDREGR